MIQSELSMNICRELYTDSLAGWLRNTVLRLMDYIVRAESRQDASDSLNASDSFNAADISDAAAAMNVSDDTDADSVRRAANMLAEKALTDYGNSILRLAYSYLHNMSDAEDILQDTLIQLIKTAPVFESDGHEKAWLLHVAGNLSKNRIEYKKLRDADELDEMLAEEKNEDLSFLWDAVKSLPAKYREVIHLFYYEGYSTEEIAGILKEKDATVRSHLNRGRIQLRSILKEAYDFE